jgi:hypothetical protein
MGIMTFKYVKAPDDTSDRVFVPISHPSEKYFGIDITELDTEDQALFTNALEDIIDEQKESIEQLMTQYDVKHKYRHFFANKMQEVRFD